MIINREQGHVLSLQTRKTLTVDGKDYTYYSLEEASKPLGDISRLTLFLKDSLENMLRYQDEVAVKGKRY